MPSGFITYIVVLQLLNLGGFARIKNQSRKKNKKIIHEPRVDHEDANNHDTGTVLSLA